MRDNPAILNRLFAKPTLGEVDEALLAGMIKEYPYFAHARWLMAAKRSSGQGGADAFQQAAVFAFHPLRLESYLGGQLKGAAPQPSPPAADTPVESPEPPAAAEETVPPLIQPLFTEDYFAYTGTKLPEHLQNDKKPTMEQLYSFTDWLRTMKKPRGSQNPDLYHESKNGDLGNSEEDDLSTPLPAADNSLRANKEVYTEAMAEVRITAGQKEKAIAIYEKLSLYYPEKSGYFAQKIADLKSK